MIEFDQSPETRILCIHNQTRYTPSRPNVPKNLVRAPLDRLRTVALRDRARPASIHRPRITITSCALDFTDENRAATASGSCGLELGCGWRCRCDCGGRL